MFTQYCRVGTAPTSQGEVYQRDLVKTGPCCHRWIYRNGRTSRTVVASDMDIVLMLLLLLLLVVVVVVVVVELVGGLPVCVCVGFKREERT